MDTIELRHLINEKISLIEDESFLVAIKTIIDSKVSSNYYKLSGFQKERISLGREQLENGQVISNDDLQSEIDLWLSTKSFDFLNNEPDLYTVQDLRVKYK